MNSGLMLSDPSLILLALLLAGHFLGDFLLPAAGDPATGRGAKWRLPLHLTVVTCVHLAVALPLIGLRVVIAVLAIVLLHGLIDVLETRVVAREPSPKLRLLALDQAAHVAVILAVWAALTGLAAPAAPPIPGFAAGLLEAWVTISVILAAFAVNAAGGSIVVAAVLGPLAREAAREDPSGTPGTGRLIGILERTIALILVLAGQWATMAILVTAKSVARFDDLKDREFAEYYLVGTLTSLLVAILIGLALSGLGV